VRGAAPRAVAWLMTAAALALAAGCGYSTKGNLPDHIKSVAVPTFKNRTQEPAVESTITAAVINAFVTSGKLKVVSADQADSILEGEVVGYDIVSVSVDNRINVRQYRLVVTMNLQFRDVRQGAMLFRQEGLQERARSRSRARSTARRARCARRRWISAAGW